METVQNKSRLNYKWVILIVCFLMEFFCLGFCSSNPGLYTKAVTEALDIQRSLYSIGNSVRYVTQIVAAVYFGTILNKFGVRKVAGVGFATLTASVLVRAFAANIIHIYIGSVLWGAGIVFAGSAMAGTIVRRWFHQDVGKYTGIVMSANGIGGAVAAQIISPFINSGTFGYRKAYILSAVIAFAIGVLAVVFLRERPAGTVAVQDSPKKKKRGSVWVGIPYNVIKKKVYFYVAAALIFLTGISLQSVGTITLVYFADVGLPASYIATIATVESLCLTFAKILVGMVYDKRGLQFSIFMCLLSATFAFVMNAVVSNSLIGMILAMVSNIFVAFAIPMETVMIPLITNDLFGSASYDKVLGVFMAMNSLGLCLGSPLADIYHDIFGTYKPCFWFFAVIFVLVAVGYHFVICAAHRDSKAILAKQEEETVTA